ncbi:MAG: ComF family protein [Candidatus Dojkabacteria bacterium]|jgi:competence protein ComFC
MNILDIIYPKSCSICGRIGYYLCDDCKKLLKRNLPECYVCRRISPHYQTHEKCKKEGIFDSVFVGWEYNDISSIFLKKYKYGEVYDIASLLETLIPTITKDFQYINALENVVVLPTPISSRRLRDRGFNQTEKIAEIVAKELGLEYLTNLLMDNDTSDTHQAFRDKEDRKSLRKDRFTVTDKEQITKYKNIIVVDDVITTGNTLNSIGKSIKESCTSSVSLHAFCLFRGKPNFSP